MSRFTEYLLMNRSHTEYSIYHHLRATYKTYLMYRNELASPEINARFDYAKEVLHDYIVTFRSERKHTRKIEKLRGELRCMK